MQPETPLPLRTSDPLFGRRPLVVYCVLVVLAFGAFVGGALIYRRGIDRYQAGRAQGAIQRIEAALTAGDDAQAKERVAELLKDTPLYWDGFGKPRSKIWEGPLLRNQVTPLEELTTKLMDHGMMPEAQQVAWKAILEYHTVSRTIELLIPWELMVHLKGAQGEWGQALEAAKILAAHGVKKVRRPGEMEPVAFKVDAARLPATDSAISQDLVRGMQQYYEAETIDEFQKAAWTMSGALQRVKDAQVRRQMTPLLHRAMIRGGQRNEARALYMEAARGGGLDPAGLEQFWGTGSELNVRVNLLRRDPFLLDLMWQERPVTSKATLSKYLDTFSNDPRLRGVDLKKLEKVDLGYFNRDNAIMPAPEGVTLGQSIAGRLTFQTDKPLYKMYFSCSTQAALGVYPILLVRFRDEDPFIPLYCDTQEPGLVSLEVNLPPGNYELTLAYLNDSGFTWKQSDIREDRQLFLHRLLFVQVPPAE